MDVLMHADEQTQEPMGVWSLRKAGTRDARYLDDDAMQAADNRVALVAKVMPWRERAEQLDPRADLVVDASQGSGAA